MDADYGRANATEQVLPLHLLIYPYRKANVIPPLLAMQVLDLLEQEVIESMTPAKIKDFDTEFVFVGTAITNEQEQDQLGGRLLAFQVLPSRKYKLIDAVQVPGVVYSVKPYVNNTLVASINGSVSMLAPACAQNGCIAVQ